MRRRLSPQLHLARAAERLEKHHLGLGLLVVAVIGVLAYVSIIAINGVPFSDPYRVRAAVPASAPLLKDGDDVRVAGQRAGQVRKVEPAARGALITMDLDKGPIGPDARARVRLRGLAGAVYIELDRGDTSRPLREGATIPRARTSTGVALTDVVAGFDRDARIALRRTLSAYGTGFTGRGAELNRALAELPETLSGTTPLLRAATPTPGALADALRQLDRTLRGFGGPAGTRDLEALVPAARRTLGAIAARSPQLGAAIDALRPAEDELRDTLPQVDPLLDDATRAARALVPGASALAAALPDVDALLEQRAALGRLSRLARALDPVLRAGRPLLVELHPGTAALAPIADALEPLAAYLARYPQDLFLGPDGFTRWGKFHYDEGQAKGSRAVRFSVVFTCQHARDPYPAPGAAEHEEAPCLF